MPKPISKINVLANPYSFVDEDGEAMGACPAPPDAGLGTPLIGAVFDEDRTKTMPIAGAGRGDARSTPQVTKFTFWREPTEVPPSPSVQQLIRSGSIVAFDAKAYAVAFGTAKGFVEPYAYLESQRLAAAKQHQADFGSPALFADGTVLVERPKEEPEPTPPVTATTATVPTPPIATTAETAVTPERAAKRTDR